MIFIIVIIVVTACLKKTSKIKKKNRTKNNKREQNIGDPKLKKSSINARTLHRTYVAASEG